MGTTSGVGKTPAAQPTQQAGKGAAPAPAAPTQQAQKGAAPVAKPVSKDAFVPAAKGKGTNAPAQGGAPAQGATPAPAPAQREDAIASVATLPKDTSEQGLLDSNIVSAGHMFEDFAQLGHDIFCSNDKKSTNTTAPGTTCSTQGSGQGQSQGAPAQVSKGGKTPAAPTQQSGKGAAPVQQSGKGAAQAAPVEQSGKGVAKPAPAPAPTAQQSAPKAPVQVSKGTAQQSGGAQQGPAPAAPTPAAPVTPPTPTDHPPVIAR